MCPHGKPKSRCKDCGGSSICEHGKEKHQCRECKGSKFCVHNKQKQTCRLCGGNLICETFSTSRSGGDDSVGVAPPAAAGLTSPTSLFLPHILYHFLLVLDSSQSELPHRSYRTSELPWHCQWTRTVPHLLNSNMTFPFPHSVVLQHTRRSESRGKNLSVAREKPFCTRPPVRKRATLKTAHKPLSVSPV